MRTDDFRPSSNVEDDREASASRGGMPGGAGGLGIGTVIIIGLISWYFGIDPSVLLNGAQILSGGGTHQTTQAPPVSTGTPQDATGRFVALVLGDTEDRWTEIFAASNKTYHPPKLRLFSGSEPGGCGMAQSAMGPFYCPRDQRIYLDTSFFEDLQNKFGGCSNSTACRFSEAYVIAHEVGHHVQDELGILPRVTQMQQAASDRTEANALQVRIELQADCLAGVWANRAQAKHNFLEAGRRRSGLADRFRNRRRPVAETGAGLCGARQLHPRLFGAAQTLVPERLHGRPGLGLRHAVGQDALV